MAAWDEHDAATTGQKAAIATILGQHGIRDRDDRLALLSYFTGWPVGSMNQLARTEASYCLDFINSHIDCGELQAALDLAREIAEARKALT